MDYKKLAKEFFYKSFELKKKEHQQMLDESLQGEMFTLFFLQEQKNFVLPGEISAEMGVSSARVATILNSLENKSLINRQIDKSDRRRILISLTKEGEQRAEEDSKKIINMIAGMLERLGEKDAKEFVRITSRIIDIAPGRIEF